MKNLFFFMLAIALICAAQVSAQNWQDDWTKAVTNCHEKNYQEAEINFNSAIRTLEKLKDNTHPHVYVDRARLYLLQERFKETLSDVNIAIKSKYLTGQDLQRALITRMMANLNLKKNDEALADLEQYKKASPIILSSNFLKTRLLFEICRNANAIEI